MKLSDWRAFVTLGEVLHFGQATERRRASRPQVNIELNDLSTHHQLLALAEGKLRGRNCVVVAEEN